jgi:hypothetical protein
MVYICGMSHVVGLAFMMSALPHMFYLTSPCPLLPPSSGYMQKSIIYLTCSGDYTVENIMPCTLASRHILTNCLLRSVTLTNRSL